MVPKSISRVSLPWMLDNISILLLDISTLVSYNHTKLSMSSYALLWVNGPAICPESHLEPGCYPGLCLSSHSCIQPMIM